MKNKILTRVLAIALVAVLVISLGLTAFATALGAGSGDVNGDGKVTAFDAQMIAEYKAGLRELTVAQLAAAGELTVQDVIDHILGRRIIEDEISVQILPFGSEEERNAAHMKLRDKDPNYSGRSTYMNVDGVDCLKLDYHSYSNLKPYRCTPCFTEAGCVDSDHKWVRVTYMTDYELPGTITFMNSANGNQIITVVEDTSASKGEWVTSAPIDISGSGIIEGAFSLKEKDVLVYFSAQAENINFYLKEITFFESEEDAYNYYGDEPDTTSIPYRVLTYDTNGTGIKKSSHADNKNDYVEFDEALGIANLQEADGTAFMGRSEYYMDLMFDLGHIYNRSYKYMRVLYSAKNPEDVDSVSMTLYNNGNGYDYVTVQESVTDTDGFVLSETVELQDTLTARFETPSANRLTFDTLASGGEYKVKAVYFFKTKEHADSLVFKNDHTVTIKGTDISEYKIIVAKDCDEVELNQAKLINARIFDLTGHVLDILTDDTPVTDYEIVIGNTNRPESTALYGPGGIYNVATTKDNKCELTYAGDNVTGNRLEHTLDEDGAIVALNQNFMGANYMFRLYFKNANYYNTNYKYMRVLYSATNPEGVDSVSMKLYNNGNGNDILTIQSEVVDTDGFVLSDVAEIPSTSGIGNRFAAQGVNTLTFGTTAAGGTYKIKAIYFFASEEEARAATPDNVSAEYDYDGYQGKIVGNKLVFASAMKAGLEELVANYLSVYLYNNKIEIPDVIELTDESVLTGSYGSMGTQAWPDADNVENPEQFADDFGKDEGYWTEESGEDNWSLVTSGVMNYKVLNYGPNGPGGTGNTAGYAVGEDGMINTVYNAGWGGNIVSLAFNGSSGFDTKEYRFIRVLSYATIPEGATVPTTLKLTNNGNGNDNVSFASNITGSGYALSATAELVNDNDDSANNMLDRFVLKGVNTLTFMGTQSNVGEYKVKAVYFFKTQDEADAATLNVSEENAYSCVLAYAGENLTGNRLEHTVDEDGAITALNQSFMGANYMFRLLFKTANTYSTDYKYMRVLYSATNPDGVDSVSMQVYNNGNGNDIVTIQSDVVNTNGFVLSDVAEIPSTSGIGGRFATTGSVNTLTFGATAEGGVYKVKAIYFYETLEAAEAAGKLNVSLETNVSDGYYASSVADNAVSYLHVYEKNVSFEADMKCVTAEDDAEMGMLLRYTAKDAYVKVGYDFDKAQWYVENREGIDFVCCRLATAPATVNVGEWYKVKAVINNKNLTLYVNDAEVLSTALLTQVTPGRIGVYANNAQVNVDNADIQLLSGMGQIIPNVVHSVLPTGFYTEGGQAWELLDGTLVYEHWSGTTFKSSDNGKTWEKASTWAPAGNIYPNILRLANGDFLKMMHESVDGVWSETAYRSSNDGATWSRVGVLAPVAHPTMSATAGNMNDKLTQMSDGRIFYGRNYQGGGRVFCEIWYSDDNGATWTESQTATYEIEGNEDAVLFGECKVMETASGTLRMYCSWNDYGHIVYSESTDNGVTWGPLQHMNDFVCSRSSMQFMKDPYADNDTTYYMVWCYGEVGRTRLSLAKTTDGVNWEYLGDVWRWENNYTHNNMLISHIVDPFITVTEDYIIVGSGISEETDDASNQSHQKQRQHIWSIGKDTLTPYDGLPDAY